MDKQVIESKDAPEVVGPYSQAIRTGNFIFLSGQIGIDPQTNRPVEGGVEAQAKQIFKNINAVLKEAGLGLQNVIKAMVFLKDMADFKKINEIYAAHFEPPYPARSAVAVKDLPLSVDIEIEVTAAC
jgi:2-iminobutanoate/2-iminopropanoate deaminase